MNRVICIEYKKSPPEGLPSGGRESSDALLSRTRRPGTIGEARLNCRVRNGNGCDPRSRIAETIFGRAGVPEDKWDGGVKT